MLEAIIEVFDGELLQNSFYKEFESKEQAIKWVAQQNGHPFLSMVIAGWHYG